MKRTLGRSTTMIFLASLLAVGNGCSKSATGTYVSEQNAGNYLELKSDKTFFVQEGGMGLAGKYELDGKQVTLKTDIGLASRGRIEGKTLIDKDGVRWTKK